MSDPKREIIERRFSDHAEAILYADDHICCTLPIKVGEEWLMFELVPVETAQ